MQGHRSRVWLALPLAALLGFVPALGHGSETAHASPRLEHLRIGSAGVFAPLADGEEARLTIDPALEHAALRLLEAAEAVRGAMLAIEVRSGKILVFAELSRDGKNHHVVTSAVMPAASVFKLVTTAALFESTELRPSDQVCVSGGAHAIERRHLDRPRTGRADCAPFSRALGFSKNAVFAQLATQRLSREALLTTAEALGFNRSAPSEVPALVGKLEVPFNDLEFARTAAGFRGSTLSPLGGAHLANVIAHDGESTEIRILDDSAADASGTARVIGRVLQRRTAQRIRRMMEVTVRSGTCQKAFTDDSGRPYLGSMRVAGKTGTLRPHGESGMASWFIGFAPSRKPEIVVSVMLENGRTWRRKANELARDLLRAYFHAQGRPGISDPF